MNKVSLVLFAVLLVVHLVLAAGGYWRDATQRPGDTLAIDNISP